MRTLRDGWKYWLALALVACLPLTGRAAMFQVPVAAGGGGGTLTNGYTFNGPFYTVNTTNVYLNAGISNIDGTGVLTNNQNSWYIWAHPTATNVAAQRYFAQNRGLSYTTNSDDFGGLLQSIFNRGVDGISIRLAASPYYTSHFVVSNTVVITNWFIMEGEGNPVTTIHGKSGMTTPVLQFGDATHFISGICRLNRIRFEGEGTSAGSVGVHVVNCAEPVFEYVEWTGFLMAGLRISTLYNTAWAYADNCWFVQKGANAHGILFDLEPTASVIGQNHFSVKNCIFGNHTTGGTGITVSNRFPGLVVQSSHFRNYSGASGEAIVLRAGGEYIIQGNQFHNFGATWPITFADRASATNYASSVIGNKAWTDGSQGQEIVYQGTFVTGVTYAGNEGGTGLASSIAGAGNNGFVNNFDKYELRIGSISRSNALVYLDSSGVAQPVTLSGLTLSAGTLTASGGSSNFITTAHGSINVTNSVTAQSFVGSGTGAPTLQMLATNNNAVVMGIANSNSVPITNLVGLLHKASAAVIVLDCNDGNNFQITNQLGQATSLIVTNLAQGQTITISGDADGTSRVVTIIPKLGYLVRDFDAFGVAAAANKAITVTNGNTFEVSILAKWSFATNFADIVTRQAKY